MFCSSCGFKQAGPDPVYCSGCGIMFGVVRQTDRSNSEYSGSFDLKTNTIRKRGLKVGGKMILSGLILVPLFGILSEFFGTAPVLAGLTALVAFWGGILRIVYALVFEGNEIETLEQKAVNFYAKYIRRQKLPDALPPQNVSFSNVSFGRQGMWRDTAETGRRNDDI